MSVTEFKAKRLAVLGEVSRTGGPVTILKRGKPVAQVVRPVTLKRGRYSQDDLRESGRIVGDIISPTTDPDDWAADGLERARPDPA